MLNPPSLQRAITWRERCKRLHPIGLTKRRSHGSVVEGADNPLRSALPDPVARAKRVQTGVEDEYRIGLGAIADCSGHRLRMDSILTSRRVGLLVEHVIPLLTLVSDLVP